MPRIRSYLLLLFAGAALNACVHKDVYSPNAGYDLNGDFMHAHDDEDAVSSPAMQGKWWLLYNNLALNALMERAFIGNPDLAQVRARLTQAQAVSRASRASLLPDLTIGGKRAGSHGDASQPSDFTLTGAASYEIDLWGKNSATFKSKRLSAAAERENLYAATISLSAEITQSWLDILSLQVQERLIQKQIETNRTVLSLQETRFEMGVASALDILQQEETLARSLAQLPDVQAEKELAFNALAALVGEEVRPDFEFKSVAMPPALPLPHHGLPSDLLANRPDVKAAWLRLVSADWAVNAAFADRLPRFDLSAVYSTTSLHMEQLFDQWLLTLVGEIVGPVFDGGRRKSEQMRQEAVADERYHAYRGAVLNAVMDVENALVRNHFQDRKIVALNAQYKASKTTLEQAQFSYANGESRYINVLNSLNNTQSLEQRIAQERLAQAKERIRLYRALGGRDWVKDTGKSTHVADAVKESE